MGPVCFPVPLKLAQAELREQRAPVPASLRLPHLDPHGLPQDVVRLQLYELSHPKPRALLYEVWPFFFISN